jgi:hypothetical protein
MLKNNVIPKFISALFLVFAFSLFCGNVNAEGLAVKVQPSTIDEKVDPGEILKGDLTITNQSGGHQTYYIGTRNVTGMNDGGTPTFSELKSDDPLEAASWINPLKKEISMNEGDSVTVPYEIHIPKNASPGSYFAAFFVTRKADKLTESGAGVGFHVASLVNLRVSGVVNEDMTFKEFYTNKSFFTKPSVYFNARLENVGTIHQRPVGIITITDMFGNKVGHVKFNERGGAILPHTDRVFEVTWNYDGFALGKYTAEASVAVGETHKQTLTRAITFWIVPVKEVGMVVGGIILFLLLFIYGVRRYIRNAIKKAGGNVNAKNKSSENISFAKRLVRTSMWIILILLVLFIGMIVFFS